MQIKQSILYQLVLNTKRIQRTGIVIITVWLSLGTGINLYSQSQLAENYYPLQIGNKWIYNLDGMPGYVSKQVIDSLQIGDHFYYQIQEIQFMPVFSPTIDTLQHYCRLDTSGRIWYGNPDSGLEIPGAIHFIKKLGIIDVTQDSTSNSTCITSIIDTMRTVETPAGEFKFCYAFLQSIQDIYLESVYVYAPHVGLVFQHGENFGYKLKGAKIGSKVFGDTTATLVENKSNLKQINFLQNYPNPFNNSTQINYSLPSDTKIKLAVYNIKGELVSTLFNGFRVKGGYSHTFTATNLPSGIYFVRLETADHITTTKINLIQ